MDCVGWLIVGIALGMTFARLIFKMKFPGER